LALPSIGKVTSERDILVLAPADMNCPLWDICRRKSIDGCSYVVIDRDLSDPSRVEAANKGLKGLVSTMKQRRGIIWCLI
jgi:hypothetical protein